MLGMVMKNWIFEKCNNKLVVTIFLQDYSASNATLQEFSFAIQPVVAQLDAAIYSSSIMEEQQLIVSWKSNIICLSQDEICILMFFFLFLHPQSNHSLDNHQVSHYQCSIKNLINLITLNVLKSSFSSLQMTHK